METDNGSRVNTARPKSTGAGGGAGGRGWPGRVSAAPPEIPGLGGDESPPRPVMGPLGRNPSSTSQGFMKVLNNKVVNTPGGLVVVSDRRGIIYRATNKDAIIRLVAEILYRITRSNKGSIIYLNNRKMTYALGLKGHFDAVTVSWIFLLMDELGIVVQSFTARKRNYIIVNVRSQIMNEIKAAKSIDAVEEIVKKHLNNGG
jgi:hypothetical protein